MPSWDIFCRVVDNYGDVGVCWRLARQFASERHAIVRLWIDDLATLSRIEPGVDATADRQSCTSVDIRRWTQESTRSERPHDVVIEAFACETPASFVEAMAASSHKHAWINLEYLSAEEWVEGCHGLPSPHPTLPLVKHFFFPGFTARTGGLLRERDLLARRDAFEGDPAARAAYRSAPGIGEAAKVVSLFAYGNAAAEPLLRHWIAGDEPIGCIVPEGVLRDAIVRVLGSTPSTGRPVTAGALTIASIPFVPQADFDRLLWDCDFNFVRGEDSFIRAQWAARPFAWHIYPQAGDAHLPKLRAFMRRYSGEMDLATAQRVGALFEAWNGSGDIADAWDGVMPVLDRWAIDASRWSERLASRRDMASQLAEFVEKLL